MKINFFNLILIIIFITFSACSVHAADEQELIAVLQSSAGPVEKCAACQQLRIYGTGRSVPALAALLGEERVGHAARYALEGIPGPEAGAVLRQALTKTTGLNKAGIIDSLGWRRDAESVPLLVPLISDADAVIAKAAASALGRIGNDEAVAALKKTSENTNSEVRLTVAEALLGCAENRLSAGDDSGAAALYADLYYAEVSTAIRTAAWRGLVLSDSDRRPELVVEALTGKDQQFQLVALKLLREIKDIRLVNDCLRQWDSLPALAQLAVLDAHVQFGAEALPTIRTASKSPHQQVRVTAWQALADLSDTSMIPALAQAAAEGEPAEREAARDTLARIHGPGVHEALLAYLKQAKSTEKAELLLAIGKRGDTAAASALLQYANAQQESVRLAALESLRRLAVTDTLGPLLDLLVTSKSDSDRNAVLKALVAVCQASPDKDDAGGRVIAAMNRMQASERHYVLPLLLELATPEALTEMLKSTQNSDAQLVRESLRLLAQWPNDKPIPDLLKIARTSENNVHRILALRGYINLTASSERFSPEQKLQNCKTAMSLATDDAEKKKILAVASGVKTADSLSFTASHISAPALKEEAALATLTIAKEIYPQNRQPAAAALKRVLAAQVGENLKKQAQQIVDEIESVRSHLTGWQVAGPYMQKDKNCTQLFDIPFGPELPDAQVQWKPMPIKQLDQHPAYLDLLEVLNGGEQRVAYLKTQIDSDVEKQARLEIFSDDGVKAWLNGQVIHANNTMRPIMPAPDIVPVTLKKGANDLMLKVTQNNLPWGAIVLLREAQITEPKVGKGFRLHAINADSRFEAAGIADFNRDGKLDIFCGGFWYQAPTWKKHFVRDVPEQGNYYYDFANLPMDIDGDGWVDIANCAWHNKKLFWLRNPGRAGGEFEVIDIDTPGNIETAMAVDINADGQLDVLPNIMSQAAWYEFGRDSSAPHGVKWTKHQLPKQAATHGIGAGDINGDGRCDIITPNGWLEQTQDASEPWLWHAEFNLGHASIPILAHDVDDDGDADIIWGMGHNYGLYWLEQSASGTSRLWQKHLIDDSWSQPHFLILVDLDNDQTDELITGKRVHAHNGNDPGGNDPPCVYYYKFDRNERKWQRHIIHEGGNVGFGISTAAHDIDTDGDIDIVAPGKSGLFLLENLLK